MKHLILTIFFTMAFDSSVAIGEIRFSPSWVIVTKSGKYIDIISLKNGQDSKQNPIFIYETSDGRKGSLGINEIANEDDLLAAIRTAQENRAVLSQKIAPPADNNQHRYSHSSNIKSRKTRNQAGKSIIVIECRNKWQDDYRMIEYCINKQQESLSRVSRMSGSILERCKAKWGNDYRMIEYCTNKQREAKRRLDQSY